MDTPRRSLRQVPTWEKGQGLQLTENGPGLSMFATVAVGLFIVSGLLLSLTICVLRIRLWRAQRRQEKYTSMSDDDQDKPEGQEPGHVYEPPDFEFIQKTMQLASNYVRRCLVVAPGAVDRSAEQEVSTNAIAQTNKGRSTRHTLMHNSSLEDAQIVVDEDTEVESQASAFC